MPDQPAPRKKPQKISRFNYAIEQEVDRTVREQNRFLDHCQFNRVEVTVFSITGASFNGIVHDHDRDTVLFGGSGKSASPRLIHKHFIAMIIPRDALNLFLEYKGLGTARSKNRKKRFIEAVEAMGVDTHQRASIDDLSAAIAKGVKKMASLGKEEVEDNAVVTTKPKRQRVTKPRGDDA